MLTCNCCMLEAPVMADMPFLLHCLSGGCRRQGVLHSFWLPPVQSTQTVHSTTKPQKRSLPLHNNVKACGPLRTHECPELQVEQACCAESTSVSRASVLGLLLLLTNSFVSLLKGYTDFFFVLIELALFSTTREAKLQQLVFDYKPPF